MDALLISRMGLSSDALKGKTVIVTGAGGGIGFEAARSLLWLGANVILAEINQASGSQAAARLSEEFDAERAAFICTDVGDETSVQNLYQEAVSRFGQVDVVLNNATIAVLGMVKDLPVAQWDASYRVNLRGPVLMARVFLPDMIRRKQGVFVCVSSTGTAFLGGYETFKAAQVHLSNTLDAELEGTGVIAFTIGPGLVPTQTATSAVGQLAPLLGMTVDEFYELNKNAVLTPEEAGTGFAISIVLAERFKGMEISSMQALKAADINFGAEEGEAVSVNLPSGQKQEAVGACALVRRTLQAQTEEWKRRSLFERQWVIRDFKKTAGLTAEEWLSLLERLEAGLLGTGEIPPAPLQKLWEYYDHLADLAKGYEKNPAKLAENLRHVYSWRDEVDRLRTLLA